MENNAKIKVLQVEDDQIEQQLLKRFVERNDIPFDLKVAGSVSAARQALASEKFDVVVSDFNIGDGTALDVIATAGDVPTIVVTGAGDEETAINALKAGAYDYLVKDLDKNYLKALQITVEYAIRRNKTENQLDLLSGAVMSTEDSIYITDMKGEIIFVNKAFCKIYGYQEQEIIRQNSSVLWMGKSQTQNTRSVFQTPTASGTWEVGFYHRRKDNSVFPVSLSRSTIKDAAKRDIAIVGVARDISDRIQVEDELREEILKYKEINVFHNELAAVVAASVQRLLSAGNTGRAAEVVKGYLDVSKINSNKVRLNRSHFNFAALVRQVEEAVFQVASDRNVTLANDLPHNSMFVYSDYSKTLHILSCLLNRAIKLANANQTIFVQARETPDKVEVAIYDETNPTADSSYNGQNSADGTRHSYAFGIESCDFSLINDVEWMKQQFYTSGEDIAMGLWLSKALVEMQGGQMWIQSHPAGKNVVICFSIPKAVVQEKSAAEKVCSVEYQ
jgi:PAS domain S-box-containing protein